MWLSRVVSSAYADSVFWDGSAVALDRRTESAADLGQFREADAPELRTADPEVAEAELCGV